MEILKNFKVEHFNSVINCQSSMDDDATDILPQIECIVLLDEFLTILETRKVVQHTSSGEGPGSDSVDVFTAGALAMEDKLTKLSP